MFLSLDLNKWDMIFDFTKDGRNRNYEFLDPSEFKIIIKILEDMEEKPVQVFPYPQKYGGTIPEDANQHEYRKEDEKMMVFNINVSA